MSDTPAMEPQDDACPDCYIAGSVALFRSRHKTELAELTCLRAEVAQLRQALAQMMQERDEALTGNEEARTNRLWLESYTRGDQQRADSAEARLAALTEKIADLYALLLESRRSHRYCEDCWYSCPKTEDGCCNEDESDDCNCGADAWNAKVDAVLSAHEGQPGRPRVER